MKELMIHTGKLQLHVFDYPANGDPVVFLHYSSGCALDWNSWVAHFEPDCHVIIPEMRGHGRSDKPESDYRIDTMADDIADLLRLMNPGPVHLVGSSMGAMVAVSLAARYPALVRSVAAEGAFQNVFGPDGRYDIPEAEVPAQKAELRLGNDGLAMKTWASRAELCEQRQAWYEARGCWNEDAAARVAYDWRELPDGRVTRLVEARLLPEMLEDVYDIRFERYYERVVCPVLFLPGEEWRNPAVQASVARFRQLLPVSQVAVVEDAPHASCIFTHTAELCRAVRDFHAGIRNLD